jgi:hypothetical protein
MSNTILIKRSNVANSVPASGNLQPGELAINYIDGNLFYKDNNGNVQTIASQKFVSVSGNVVAGNIQTIGTVSATGNITGNYFIGNGSQLTGLASGVAGNSTSIQYNNSGVLAGSDNFTFNQTTNTVSIVGTLDFISGGGNFIGLAAPSSVTSNVVYKLPSQDGMIGNVLATDGSGNTFWTGVNTGDLDIIGRSGTITVATYNGKILVYSRSGIIPVPLTK